MEKLVAEIKRMVQFKETTNIGDIVLIAAEEPQMLVYALVSDITRDNSRKDEWYHLELVFLSVPPQVITWTLRPEQMTGEEIFTMGGNERFVQAIDVPVGESKHAPNQINTAKKQPVLKRIK